MDYEVAYYPVEQEGSALVDWYSNHGYDAIICADTEWDASKNDVELADDMDLSFIRSHASFISLQLRIWTKASGEYKVMVKIGDAKINFFDLFKILKDPLPKSTLIKKFTKKDLKDPDTRKKVMQRKPKLLLLGHWGGVDWSIFDDFDDILQNPNVMVLDKQAAITRQLASVVYFDRHRHLHGFRYDIRDTIKLAPGTAHGLDALGDTINFPKLDTEKWDVEDGYDKGFYKTHMGTLLKNRPDDFVAYAMRDVDVTWLYADSFIKKMIELPSVALHGLPMTLGSLSGSSAGRLRREDDLYERAMLEDLYDRKVISLDYYNDKTVDTAYLDYVNGDIDYDEFIDRRSFDNSFMQLVKGLFNTHLADGYRQKDSHKADGHKDTDEPLTADNVVPYDDNHSHYQDERAAYFGGYNVAHNSGYYNADKYKVDIDLKSAYNVSGHLIPKFYLNKPWDSFTASSETNHCWFKVDQHGDRRWYFDNQWFLDKIAAINGPYTVGLCNAAVYFDDNNDNLILNPYRAARDYGQGPKYVRYANSTWTITDVYNAILGGAHVGILSFSIASQEILYENGTTQSADYEMNWAGQFQDQMAQLRAKYKKGTLENLLYKELGNSVYGKTGQGTHAKKTRSIVTNEMSYEPLSPISNPILAAQYTAITRYHIRLLTLAIKQLGGEISNVTTDGALVLFDKPFEKIDKQLYQLMQSYAADPMGRVLVDNAADPTPSMDTRGIYQLVTDTYFNGAYYEQKGEGKEEGVELRTRVNGVLNTEIGAQASIKDGSAELVVNAIKNHQAVYVNEQTRISSLYKMIHEDRIKHMLSESTVPIHVALSYDFSRKPNKFHVQDPSGLGYFDTVPFETVEEQSLYKAVAMGLLKHEDHFLYDAKSFKYFKATMFNVEKNNMRTTNKITMEYRAKQLVAAIVSGQQDFKSLKDIDKDTLYQQLVDLGYSKTIKTFKNMFYKKVPAKKIDWFTAYRLAIKLQIL